MKILSMNVHSLIETEEEKKLLQFADMVAAEQPDLIGLQEVSQTRSAPAAGSLAGVPEGLEETDDRAGVHGQGRPEREPEGQELRALEGYTACGERKGEHRSPVLLRRDNYALRLAARLRELKTPYYWTWIPVKLGYGKYDEGLALFSRTPILDTDRFFISRSQDYANWKTREILGIRTQPEGYAPVWAYTVHMGWWDDEEEPFKTQWEQVEKGLKAGRAGEGVKTSPRAGRIATGPGPKAGSPLVWLMGDFNSPAQVRGEGYDLIAGWGWKDTYHLAEEKDSGITVEGVIDGWRDKLAKDQDLAGRDGADEKGADEKGTDEKGPNGERPGEGGVPGMRIDHIWCSKKVEICRSEVVCNGRRYPKVSDHNGVMVTL